MHFPIEELIQGQKEILSKISILEKKIPENQSIVRYTPQELADKAKVSVQLIWAALKDGRIKGKKFGKRYLITADEFERACEEIKTIKYKRN